MGLEVAIGAALIGTVYSGVEQYRATRKAEKAQKQAANVQAGLQEIENRREGIRRSARARVLQAQLRAGSVASGTQDGSVVSGQVSGVASTLGSDIGAIFSQGVAGEQLSRINDRLASAQTRGAQAGAIGAISGTVFQGLGGFQGLSAMRGGTAASNAAVAKKSGASIFGNN